MLFIFILCVVYLGSIRILISFASDILTYVFGYYYCLFVTQHILYSLSLADSFLLIFTGIKSNLTFLVSHHFMLLAACLFLPLNISPTPIPGDAILHFEPSSQRPHALQNFAKFCQTVTDLNLPMSNILATATTAPTATPPPPP